MQWSLNGIGIDMHAFEVYMRACTARKFVYSYTLAINGSQRDYRYKHSSIMYVQFDALLQYAYYSSTHMSYGKGSIQIRLMNMRQPVIFGLFKGGRFTGACVPQCTS